MEGPPSGVQELCSVALYGDKTYPREPEASGGKPAVICRRSFALSKSQTGGRRKWPIAITTNS